MTVAKEGKVDYIDARERVFTVDAPSGDLSIDLPDTYYDFIWYNEEGMPTIQKTQAKYYLIVTDAIGQDVATPPIYGAYKQN